MKLLVVRHAIAEDISFTGRDQDRPLSPKGREKFKALCQKLSHLGLKFDLLLDSPLLRAQETADIFCKYFPVKTKLRTQNLKPLAEPEELFLEIKAHNTNSTVIFGHQPFLTRFIVYCLTENSNDFISLKRGGMAFLEFPGLVQPGSAIMKALLAPKFLLKN